MYDFGMLFLLFMIYSLLGWMIEGINFLFLSKKFVNRGFLIGPYCPIYGVGSIFMILFLKPYQKNPFVLLLMTIMVCSILEYMTSYLMEKIFKARWWDYSQNKFNINGRICLETMILFGIGGCIILYVVNPFLVRYLSMVPNFILNAVSCLLFIIFLIDNIVSYKIILNFKKVASSIYRDSTEEISQKVRSILANKSIFGRRLMNAFPNVRSILKTLESKRIKIKRRT